ncbi:MAG: TIGR04211 family SH3 domain-containing protein, partial [Gammaproteobacteria bacterium]|nr:TIGR04211 family SH3 domain-containing protein [Gammaproteobacteria bacterium]
MRINDHLRRLAQHAPWLVLPLIAVFSAHAQDAQDEVAALFVSDKLIVGMRAGPGEAFARVANLSTGDRLIPLGDERDGYTRVGLSSGVEGWVQSQYLTEDEPAGNRLRQVERATELLEIEKQRLTEVNRALELDQSEAQ